MLRLPSHGIRKKAKRRGVTYSFLFLRAEGDQLGKIASFIESGTIRATVDRVFPLDATAEALASAEQGRAKGKVVIKVRWAPTFERE
jgi:NADPH:quinone reductase-like Zn-dependent oxidoreductase